MKVFGFFLCQNIQMSEFNVLTTVKKAIFTTHPSASVPHYIHLYTNNLMMVGSMDV